jgi:hypothetical protein
MNGQHALVYDGARTLIWSRLEDPASGRYGWVQSNPADFRLWYEGWRVPDGRRFLGLGDYWLRHPQARRYRHVRFQPAGQVTPDTLNLWQGFAVDAKAGAWPRLQEHLYETVAGANETVYDYLLNWAAALVQRPGQPGQTAIVLRGRPGAGKGILVRALGRLLGAHFVHLTHSGQLTSRFNGILADAVLVFADEVVWAGDRAAEGALKGLITEPTLAIERKGREIIQVPNVVHLMMASNREWVAPVGISDRRFCVLDVLDVHRGEAGYFNAIAHEQSNGGAQAMLFDLLNRPLDAYYPQALPYTKARRDQTIATLEPFDRWWHDQLDRGEIAGIPWGPVPRATVYDHYLATMAKWRVPHPFNEVWMGRQILRVCPAMASRRGTLNVRQYFPPSLAGARMAFEALLGLELLWATPSVEEADE